MYINITFLQYTYINVNRNYHFYLINIDNYTDL